MFPSSDRAGGLSRALPIALSLGAALILALSLGAWLWHIRDVRIRGLAEYFFARQDMWVLDMQALALAGLALWALALRRPDGSPHARAGGNWPIAAGIAIAMLVAWLGRNLVFHGYSPSRDEVMVELAGAYLADGHIGWSIPAEWIPYRRALMPEFYSPYGADTHWTAIYLPVHAAIRALFGWLGSADLAAPVTLAAGLAALWHVARKLMPDRRDAVMIVMIMALTSAQLVTTAMTPYAMTSHFAFNMVWLALVLRGDRLGHGMAAIVALLAAGLHQWHFPLLFIGPFILWMAANRRWGGAAFHALVMVAMMIIWARLWPMALTELVGAAPPSDAHRTNGIFDKLQSLFGRLEKWQPLLNNARLVGWNNLMLLPLAGLSMFAVRWRGLLREVPIAVPLLLGVLIGMGLALYQGYGWGFRYMHGQMGALCLLAGLGWRAVVPEGGRQMRLVAAAAIFSLLSGLWLVQDSEGYVRGYARTMAAIRAADADVVLVDIRGGYYMTDLVRFDEGRLARPAVIALQMLSEAQIDRLCATKRVAIMDRSQFWPLGVHPVVPRFAGSEYIQQRRDHMAAIGCGRPVIATPAGAHD
ncbi:MFS transporter [Sphingobium nicotianae]|uniref:MFS transporter n=1 Tax=Sphingobium nicotianae TaxID=2782607 RepID=A0A9X1AI76_9SPHN|nr:MFS transporter [Sphingobium nicotianae]MBT2185712.1 MFS transporter [Sphingobium nicotianae]